MKMRAFDIFSLMILLFFLASLFLVHARFVRYLGQDNIAEFWVYTSVVVLGLFFLWRAFRHNDWDPLLLIALVMGVGLHCGGLVPVGDGKRVYDLIFLGVRFDKYVHFFNSFVAVQVVLELFKFEGVFLGKLRLPAVLLIGLGLGAGWEIIEFVVVRTIPHNGVGLYDNNMLDLVANLFGGLFSLLVDMLRRRYFSFSPLPAGKGS